MPTLSLTASLLSNTKNYTKIGHSVECRMARLIVLIYSPRHRMAISAHVLGLEVAQSSTAL